MQSFISPESLAWSSYRSVQDIPELRRTTIRELTEHTRRAVVLGCVTRIGSIKNFETPNGGQRRICTFIIRDSTDSIAVLTWGSLATIVSTQLRKGGKIVIENPVVKCRKRESGFFQTTSKLELSIDDKEARFFIFI